MLSLDNVPIGTRLDGLPTEIQRRQWAAAIPLIALAALVPQPVYVLGVGALLFGAVWFFNPHDVVRTHEGLAFVRAGSITRIAAADIVALRYERRVKGSAIVCVTVRERMGPSRIRKLKRMGFVPDDAVLVRLNGGTMPVPEWNWSWT